MIAHKREDGSRAEPALIGKKNKEIVNVGFSVVYFLFFKKI